MSQILPEQRLSVITLGVADLEASRAFYEGILGFRPFGPKEIAMYDMGGFVLGVWGAKDLAKDIGLMGNTPGAYPSFALAYNARSEAEVDEIFERLHAADVYVANEPHKTDWGGYGGYFTDPDGHAWEVVYNPHWPLQEDGSLILPSDKDDA